MEKKYVIAMMALLAIALSSCKKENKNGDMTMNHPPMVYIISPEDGAEVKSPVTVKFGAMGVDIVPAGTDEPHSGHHHLLVDVDTLPDMTVALPKDEHHIHFGKGQTETTIELKPGKHTLQLVLGDKDHIPHNPPMVSKKITITVK